MEPTFAESVSVRLAENTTGASGSTAGIVACVTGACGSEVGLFLRFSFSDPFRPSSGGSSPSARVGSAADCANAPVADAMAKIDAAVTA